MVNHQMLQLRG